MIDLAQSFLLALLVVVLAIQVWQLWSGGGQKESIWTVKLEPGDGLIVKMPATTPESRMDKISEQLSACYPGHPVLVVSGAIDIGIIERNLAEREPRHDN